MRNRLLVAALCLTAFASLAFTYQRAPQKWEYTQTQNFGEANKLGDSGWELVAATGYDGAITNYTFKRPKP